MHASMRACACEGACLSANIISVLVGGAAQREPCFQAAWKVSVTSDGVPYEDCVAIVRRSTPRMARAAAHKQRALADGAGPMINISFQTTAGVDVRIVSPNM